VLFEQLNFAFIVLLDNLSLSFFQLNIFDSLLLLCNILYSLSNVVLLEEDLLTHLDVLGNKADLDQHV
jgi:hypothetical protein